MLETLDFTIRIGSTPTFLYFDLWAKFYLLIIKHGPMQQRGKLDDPAFKRQNVKSNMNLSI